MKALLYFILFYASIFLISMIPSENAEKAQESNRESVYSSNSNKETSYNEFSDSVNKHVLRRM